MNAYPGFLLFSVLLLIYLVRRNEELGRLRQDYHKRIESAEETDILLGRPHEWRYEAFDRVGYHEMLFKFCVPLDDFYKDKSFLDPSAMKPKAG